MFLCFFKKILKTEKKKQRMLQDPKSRTFWTLFFFYALIHFSNASLLQERSNSTSENSIACNIIKPGEVVECIGVLYKKGEETLTPQDPLFFAYLGGSIFLVLFGGKNHGENLP